MESATPKLPPLRLPFHQRRRSIRSSRAVHELLVHGWTRETVGDCCTCSERNRSCEGGCGRCQGKSGRGRTQVIRLLLRSLEERDHAEVLELAAASGWGSVYRTILLIVYQYTLFPASKSSFSCPLPFPSPFDSFVRGARPKQSASRQLCAMIITEISIDLYVS